MVCWHMPLIPTLRRQKHVDFYDFEFSVMVSSRQPELHCEILYQNK